MRTKATSKEKRTLLKKIQERFGIEENIFKNLKIHYRSKERIYLGPKYIPLRPKVVSPGILIFRGNKPTSNFFHIFGNKVKKNFLEVNTTQAKEYIEGKDLEIKTNIEEGYILIKYKSIPLGCALLKNNKIRNLLPKQKRLDIAFI